MTLSDSLEIVSFMAGGQRFAVEAWQVRTLLPEKSTATLATAEQLLGLSGGETQESAARRILMIKHQAGDYAVSVSEPVELLGLRARDIFPLPPLIAARGTLAGLRALALVAEGVTMLVDFRLMKLSAPIGIPRTIEGDG